MVGLRSLVSQDFAVTIRNTFLHCTASRTGESDDAEDSEEEQPSIGRATTAPVVRPSQAELHFGEENIEEEENFDVEWKDEDPSQDTCGDDEANPALEFPDEFSMQGGSTANNSADTILLGRTTSPLTDPLAGFSDSESASRTHSEKVPPCERQTKSSRRSNRRNTTTASEKALDVDGKRTTVMLRNLPNNYTRTMLLELLDSEGFVTKYNFVYMPVDFRTRAALGYAFINMVRSVDAEALQERFEGFAGWSMPSNKVCSASWSHPHQGLQSHIVRYKSSPLMHEAVPDEYRPVLFSNGERIAFPPPTKKVKPPRQGTQRMLV